MSQISLSHAVGDFILCLRMRKNEMMKGYPIFRFFTGTGYVILDWVRYRSGVCILRKYGDCAEWRQI